MTSALSPEAAVAAAAAAIKRLQDATGCDSSLAVAALLTCNNDVESALSALDLLNHLNSPEKPPEDQPLTQQPLVLSNPEPQTYPSARDEAITLDNAVHGAGLTNPGEEPAGRDRLPKSNPRDPHSVSKPPTTDNVPTPNNPESLFPHGANNSEGTPALDHALPADVRDRSPEEPAPGAVLPPMESVHALPPVNPHSEVTPSHQSSPGILPASNEGESSPPTEDPLNPSATVSSPASPNSSNSSRPEPLAMLDEGSTSQSSESTDVIGSDTEPEPEPEPEPGPSPKPERWDFTLPKIELDEMEDNRFPDEGAAPGAFSIEKLTYGLQNGLSNPRLQNYLSYYSSSPTILSSYLNTEVEDYPAIFYAVATNDEGIVRTWVNHGGDVNVVEDNYSVPLLAFAVLTAEHCENDTTEVLTTLLSLGADASVIPRAFFTPYLTDLPIKGPTKESLTDILDDKRKWCMDYIRPKLAAALNLSQRYFLDKTLRTKQPSIRQRWVAARHNSTAMLGISYFLIGQPTASAWLIERLLSYIVLPKKKPLVLIFAGPSGHGKTELAKRLGGLLSLQMERVDMTEMRHETDLFGPKAPYVGSEHGSPLNNFLVSMSGQKSIVFLDEFEKTGPEVLNALLIPFDEGTLPRERSSQFPEQGLTPRRTLHRQTQASRTLSFLLSAANLLSRERSQAHIVDCSKTIWILATNALDKKIKSFCEKHEREIFGTEDHQKIKKTVKALQKSLKSDLGEKFGYPLAGRINTILPFLPFSLGEQAVVTHKFVLQLARSVRKPIKIPNTPQAAETLLGNIELVVRRDATVCVALAKDEYNPDVGARSLQNAVDESIVQPLVAAYLDVDEDIREGTPLAKFEFDVQPDGEIVTYLTKGR